MQVIRARRAGFCMGVAMALRKLDRAVREVPRGRVATLGAIIHNPQVLKKYAHMGVRRLDSPSEAEQGMTVLIRAHGVSRETEAALRETGVALVDATCPRVKKAQQAIAGATAAGAALLLFGDAPHPEVRGLVSYAAGPYHVFNTREELDAILSAPGKMEGNFALAAQTTQDRPFFDALRKELDVVMDTKLVVLDTICDATRQRQEEIPLLAERAEVMVVVGGRESANTRRLADIAAGCGVPVALVESERELDPAFFAGKCAAGLTAGASTPGNLIDAVERALRFL
jgi:4-hydroxy-3-methylbut-2-enyl diphosphate reductase